MMPRHLLCLNPMGSFLFETSLNRDNRCCNHHYVSIFTKLYSPVSGLGCLGSIKAMLSRLLLSNGSSYHQFWSNYPSIILMWLLNTEYSTQHAYKVDLLYNILGYNIVLTSNTGNLSKYFYLKTILLQWQFLRGPLAEWQETRTWCWESWEVVVSRRVDPGLQRSLWSPTVHIDPGQVRGNMGQWSPGWLWIRNIRWWR